jgi:outer membrane protein OmpA-like peptidoglycan-associated protein
VAKVCAPGPYIVFFEWDKSNITPEAAGILDNAITAYQNCGNAQVMLAGHADRSGKPAYNVGLSQRRADAVKAYMSSRSIPEGVITTQAFGEGRPLVETADGVRELQNRRVEVTYGPGSGN